MKNALKPTHIAAAAAVAALGALLALSPSIPAQAQDAKAPATAASAAKPTGKAALTVSVVSPQTTDLAQVTVANGSVAAWQEASVATEANGLRLIDLRANVGDMVRKGQVLATFASDTLQAEVAQAKASVAEAQANAADAAANADRARSLKDSGALSASQITQLTTAELSSKARVLALEAMLKTQELRMKQTVVLAPDNGIVTAKAATIGAVLPAGFELFRLMRQGRIEWRAEVPAADLPRMQPGATVKINPTGAAPTSGKLRMVSPTVDPQTRNATVYVDMPAGSAKPGMYARGEFMGANASALTLPATSVVLRDGFSTVMRVDAGNKVSQVKVGLGRRSGDRLEITSGVKTGEQFVLSGAAFLADGDTVKIVPQAPGAAK